jgi:hypothetical protein
MWAVSDRPFLPEFDPRRLVTPILRTPGLANVTSNGVGDPSWSDVTFGI